MLIAVPLVAGFEGYASKPYVDRIGTGQPVTWCYGATGADTGGKVPPLNAIFTKAECTQELQDKLTTVYDVAIRKCIHGFIPPHREAALVSAGYNLGSGVICNGPIARDLNAGNIVGGCHAFLDYTHARGVVVQGLVRRRQIERQLCLRND
jgi:lysozyme